MKEKGTDIKSLPIGRALSPDAAYGAHRMSK
jgi:hypothetical protein